MNHALSGSPTEVCFVNHASVLVRNGSHYLLTDPWHQRPAFGSWLPSLPQYMHPAYFAALGDRLAVLISHGHDDHCDDEFLAMLDRNTQFVTANFSSPSVSNRLRRLGFDHVTAIDSDGTQLPNGMVVKSYITPTRSLDDATFTIDTGDGLIVHCNDNWFEFDRSVHDAISRDRERFDDANVMFLSQTNSASGYPLNYRGLSAEQKADILKRKVRGMVVQGLKNARALGLSRMFSYAGFASVFVKDKPEYNTMSMFPTARFLKENLLDDVESRELRRSVDIAEFYPGDVVNLRTGVLSKAFISSAHYSDAQMRSSTLRYYEQERIVERCDTFQPVIEAPFDAARLHHFMEQFNQFVVRKTAADGRTFESVIGKSFEIHVTDADVRCRLVFGEGVVSALPTTPPNKRLLVTTDVMTRVLDGSILFENLYTGYEGEWERHPPDVYNRDIVMFIVMYSYLYKNRLARDNRQAGVSTA